MIVAISRIFSFIAAGSGNVVNNANTFILGSNITTGLPNYTYVNNLSSLGYVNAKKVNIGSSDTTVPLIVGLSGANYNVSITNNGIARYHLYNGGNVTEWVLGQKSSTDHSFKLTSRVGVTETDYVTISATNGYVGLGTSTPFAPLDIALNSTPNNTRQAIFARGADSNFIFAARNGDSTNNTGNVLGSIGVDYIGNSPSPNNDTASIKFLRGGAGQDGATTFWTNSAERIRIDSSGNVGIGTKVPNKTLTVIGTVSSTGAATFGGDIQTNSNNISVNASATNNANLYLTTTARSYALYSNVADGSLGIYDSSVGAGQRLTISITGNVGIGTTVPSSKLTVVGDISATGTLTTNSVNVSGNVNAGNIYSNGVLLANSTGSVQSSYATHTGQNPNNIIQIPILAGHRYAVEAWASNSTGTPTSNWTIGLSSTNPAFAPFTSLYAVGVYSNSTNYTGTATSTVTYGNNGSGVTGFTLPSVAQAGSTSLFVKLNVIFSSLVNSTITLLLSGKNSQLGNNGDAYMSVTQLS